MLESFTWIAIYAVVMGMMLATFFLCGIYLIYTQFPLKKPDFKANIPVRKLGGWTLITLGLLYIHSGRLIVYLPEWGTKDSGLDLWGMYIQQDSLLFMIVGFPLFFLFIFNMVEKVKKEQILNAILPVIAPAVLYLHFRIKPSETLYVSSLSFWCAYMSVMCVLYIRRVIQYEKRILEQHSNIENRLLWRFWLPFGLFLTTMIIGMILGVFKGNYLLLIIHVFLNICCTLTLVWSVDNLEGNVEETLFAEEEKSTEDELDEFTQQRMDTIEKRLQNLLLEDPPFFLTPNLGLSDLSLLVGTNRTYLGQYFHYKNTNFYSFVNELRINYACELMDNTDKKLLLNEVAEKSGFNNTRTFRRVFEEQKHCSPSDWNRGGVLNH